MENYSPILVCFFIQNHHRKIQNHEQQIKPFACKQVHLFDLNKVDIFEIENL